MKKYSEVIESLKISGADGVGGKASDLSTSVRKTTIIKGDPAHKSLPLQPLPDPPQFDQLIMTGGISQSFFS
jgi:stearoyl-CoA desaturase (delta-9 desaturase)